MIAHEVKPRRRGSRLASTRAGLIPSGMQIRRVGGVVLLGIGMLMGAHAVAAKEPKPVPVSTPLPIYTQQLRDSGKEGRVTIDFTIGSRGEVTGLLAVENSDEPLAEQAVAAIARWRFKAPGADSRITGRNWRTSFNFAGGVVTWEGIWENPDKVENARILKTARLKYPERLGELANGGLVVLTVFVTEQGDVEQPKVLVSSHQKFEAAAIESVLKWKFKPAMRDGFPIRQKVTLPFLFRAIGSWGVDISEDPYVVSKGKQDQLPEELRFDVPPDPFKTVLAVHPYDQAIAGKKGHADVAYVVGSNGRVLHTKILEASEPEFGMALAAALDAWEFRPAKLNGEPTDAVIRRKLDFKPRMRESAIDEKTAALIKRIQAGKFAPVPVGELDGPIKPTYRVLPVYPTRLMMDGVSGAAQIEVIVDKKGRAVLPRIVEASAPEFGWAAATAAQRWRFEPPTKDGKPVEVKVVIPFKFAPPEPAAN